MKVNLKLNDIIIFSEKNNKYFFTQFSDGTNLIYGKNTSGKSTLIQLIFYAFGINDNKIKLREIISEEIFVRLDCTITKNSRSEHITFLRQDETLYIRDENYKIIKFNGISANNSLEHIKLKSCLKELFNYDLMLESNSGVVEAPIETMFLPYYISQDVGWIYFRNSFSNLQFYKNFKEDFLDYYLGIENQSDRTEKRELQKKVNSVQQQINFLINIQRENQELEVSELLDSSLKGKANKFILNLSGKKGKLLKLENEYVKKSNRLSFMSQRLTVVIQVKRNINEQFPGKNNCPTCTQILPHNIESIYNYFQEENDSIALESELKLKIKSDQTDINSISTKIEKLKDDISTDNKIYEQYSEKDITLKEWIDNKAKLKLRSNILEQIGELESELELLKNKLKEFKTDEEILEERRKYSYQFEKIFLSFNTELNISNLDEDRFKRLYNISSFPFQGVELHKAVLSYNFAFNKLISKTSDIHRFPFILDSIFKEDVELGNKEVILKFIQKNSPDETQTIFSIADDKNKDSKIDAYSSEIFNNKVNLICIGDGVEERALLKKYDSSHDDLINDTFEIMGTV
jgi:hypothetical protein